MKTRIIALIVFAVVLITMAYLPEDPDLDTIDDVSRTLLYGMPLADGHVVRFRAVVVCGSWKPATDEWYACSIYDRRPDQAKVSIIGTARGLPAKDLQDREVVVAGRYRDEKGFRHIEIERIQQVK